MKYLSLVFSFFTIAVFAQMPNHTKIYNVKKQSLTINETEISIEVFQENVSNEVGMLIQEFSYEQGWLIGVNEPIKISISKNFNVGLKQYDAGTYSVLMFHPKSGRNCLLAPTDSLTNSSLIAQPKNYEITTRVQEGGNHGLIDGEIQEFGNGSVKISLYAGSMKLSFIIETEVSVANPDELRVMMEKLGAKKKATTLQECLEYALKNNMLDGNQELVWRFVEITKQITPDNAKLALLLVDLNFYANRPNEILRMYDHAITLSAIKSGNEEQWYNTFEGRLLMSEKMSWEQILAKEKNQPKGGQKANPRPGEKAMKKKPKNNNYSFPVPEK